MRCGSQTVAHPNAPVFVTMPEAVQFVQHERWAINKEVFVLDMGASVSHPRSARRTWSGFRP